MNQKDLHRQLVERYISGEASTTEVEAFFYLLNEGQLDEYLEQATREGADPLLRAESQSDELSKEPGIVRKMRRYSVAAAVILLAGLGIFFWLRPKPQVQPPMVNIFKNEVTPGGTKALLTLADGSTIVLDSAEKGNLASQGNARIIKVDAGQLSYKVFQKEGAAAQHAAVYYNTISTPAGGQYQVILADGTKVWLNALSTLRFPTAFRDTARVVELTGEAYFEVAPVSAKEGRVPFTVHVAIPSANPSSGGGMQVQVLGTHFNINAYGNEPAVRTTLLEGSVKLVKGNKTMQLRPGEQGQSLVQGGEASFLLVRDADVEQVIAWKNGHFSFAGADVYAVMRQISRWYGVEVRYEGNPSGGLFGGEIERGLNLTQVLTGLSKTGLHFRLEGKMLTVLP